MHFMRITTAGVGLAAAAGLGIGGAALAQAREMSADPQTATAHNATAHNATAHSESQGPDRIVTPGRNTALRMMWSPAAFQRSRQ